MLEPRSLAAHVVVGLLATLTVAVALRSRAQAGADEPSPARCAWAAGAGAGAIAGVLLAQPTPTNWLMSDVAWHVAKLALAADGAPLEDPILRVPTIYPFLFHVALAPFVKLGCAAQDVLRALTPVLLALTLWSYFRLQRVLASPVAAAWTALALPFLFYAPRDGYAFLPNPFNASLPLVFAGLTALARAPAEVRSKRALAGGLALGAAGLMWYGHLPWIVLAVLVVGVRRRAWLSSVVLGALPCALVLLVHVGRLASTGALDASAIAGEESAPWSERLPGLARNLLTLSGGAALDGAPWWLGPALVAVLVATWVRRARTPGPAWMLLRVATACVALCLLAAGARMTFWQPFSWRYGFLLFSLALCFASGARSVRVAGWWATPAALLALVAPWWAGHSALERLEISRRSLALFREGGDEVASYLRVHTRRDEPVFATFDTWDRAIGCAEPRPTLVARRGGLYNFAPASVVAPRWRDYQELLALDSADAARDKLARYGFRLAVLSDADVESPGLAALANGFATVLVAPPYRIIDLARPRR